MALFFLNACKFTGCDLQFATLADLIQHIEESHVQLVDEDKEQETQQSQCIALSQVSRVFTHFPSKKATPLAIDSHSPSASLSHSQSAALPMPCKRIKLWTGGQKESSDQKVSETEDDAGSSSDSSESSADNRGIERDSLDDIVESVVRERSHSCSVNGCQKRYRTFARLRKHMKTTHGIDAEPVREPKISNRTFNCHCGKVCYSQRSLQQHKQQAHETVGVVRQAIVSLPKATVAVLSPSGQPPATSGIQLSDNSTSVAIQNLGHSVGAQASRPVRMGSIQGSQFTIIGNTVSTTSSSVSALSASSGSAVSSPVDAQLSGTTTASLVQRR